MTAENYKTIGRFRYRRLLKQRLKEYERTHVGLEQDLHAVQVATDVTDEEREELTGRIAKAMETMENSIEHTRNELGGRYGRN